MYSIDDYVSIDTILKTNNRLRANSTKQASLGEKKALKRRTGERIFEFLLLLSAVSSIAIVFLLIGYLGFQGYPAVVDWLLHGFGFLIPYMFTTVYVGVGAVAIATAIGLPTAIYLAEFSEFRIRNLIKPSMETLSGIPSVVMGVIGAFIIAPAVASFFVGISGTSGLCVLTAWIVLAIMSLPFVVSIAEDALRAVPNSYREASQGLGATKWQTTFHVVLPEARSGILAAILLALASALGETMAVWMVIGNTIPTISLNPLLRADVISTFIARYIYNQESVGDLSPLYGAGLILLAMIGVINIAVAMLARRRLYAVTIHG
jgi:phosphate transport system permease protein